MIFNLHIQRVGKKTQPHPSLLRSGMSRDVVQGLLHDAVDVNGGSARERKGIAGFFIGHGYAGLALDCGEVPAEGGFESGLIEHHRVQRLRKAADSVERVLSDLTYFAK